MRPLLFCNTAWMKHYQGLRGDIPKGGGSYVVEHGTGSEIYNFAERKGSMRGYVQVTGTIHLERLGAAIDDEELKGVTVVWVAPSPLGNVIVGYYDNATVFREIKKDPNFQDHDVNVIADAKHCHLIPVDMRTFEIPRGRDGMGQSNIWYADNISSKFIGDVRSYLKNPGRLLPARRPSRRKNPTRGRQSDPLKRLEVEKKAITAVIRYFSRLGYTVTSYEKDNLGWDLQASLNTDKYLRLEVKGLSGSFSAVELTPNEFENMQTHASTYRVCVVSNALRKPNVAVFSYSPEQRKWEDNNVNALVIHKIIGARLQLR